MTYTSTIIRMDACNLLTIPLPGIRKRQSIVGIVVNDLLLLRNFNSRLVRTKTPIPEFNGLPVEFNPLHLTANSADQSTIITVETLTFVEVFFC